MKRLFFLMLIIAAASVLSACAKETLPSNTAVAKILTGTSQALDSTPVQPSLNVQLQSSSSDTLGICFSYPQGYTQVPDIDTLEILAPEIPGANSRELFWLETSDAHDRGAEVIADQDLTTAKGVAVNRWTLTLDGEAAVVLDGMPGQDLQRRVYVVHQQTLYVLAFMPTLSQDQAVNDQMEALYTAITDSWKWSSCSAGE